MNHNHHHLLRFLFLGILLGVRCRSLRGLVFLLLIYEDFLLEIIDHLFDLCFTVLIRYIIIEILGIVEDRRLLYLLLFLFLHVGCRP